MDETVYDAAWRAYKAAPRAVANGPSRSAVRAAVDAALAARQPVGQQPVCSGGFVIANGSGEKYMAWGQVGPQWVEDRSAALWLVRRADAEALAAENEDAWSILPVERCALPPSGWACTLADGHEGPCPTIAAPLAQIVDQQVGQQPVAYTSETQLKAVRVCGDGIMSQRNAGWTIPLYSAPAQTVDLGQLRNQVLGLTRRVEPISGQRFSYVQLDDVLALIESPAGEADAR